MSLVSLKSLLRERRASVTAGAKTPARGSARAYSALACDEIDARRSVSRQAASQVDFQRTHKDAVERSAELVADQRKKEGSATTRRQ